MKRFMALNLASITVWIVSTGWLVAIFPHQPMWLVTAFWVSGGWFVPLGLCVH